MGNLSAAAARVLYLTAIMAALLLMLLATDANAQTAEQRAAINKYAKLYNVDPKLMLAIAGVESGYNNNAVGALGEQGLFQLRPEFHKAVDLRTTDGNVRTAARYLAYLRARCGPSMGSAYFLCYNTGPNRKSKNPKQATYYKRVVTLYRQQLAQEQHKIRATPYVD